MERNVGVVLVSTPPPKLLMGLLSLNREADEFRCNPLFIGAPCLALCLRLLCGDIGFVYPAMSMVVIGPSLLY